MLAPSMAVRIRLQRLGKKNRPFYRIVVVDSRFKRDGRFIEILGHYNPLARDENNVVLNVERYKHWVSHGALPSDRVETFLRRSNLAAPAPSPRPAQAAATAPAAAPVAAGKPAPAPRPEAKKAAAKPKAPPKASADKADKGAKPAPAKGTPKKNNA